MLKMSAWEPGLPERQYILEDRHLTFCLVKLCHSWTIPDNVIYSNLEMPLKSESATIPGQLKPWKNGLDSFLLSPICSKAVIQKFSEMVSVLPETSKGAMSQQC